ncbi:hypothetical protein HOC80_04185 [archaeon]|jgi:hypothetical protein|nr:hypothetical protein [archaeon]MBT4417273.1 hypothetical protein [archaeon]
MGKYLEEQRRRRNERAKMVAERSKKRKNLVTYLSERFAETEMSIDRLAVLSFPYLDDPLITIHSHAKKLEKGYSDTLPAHNIPRPGVRANMLRRVAVSVYWMDQCIGGGDEMVERITAVYPDFEAFDLGDTVVDISASLDKLDGADRGLVASTAHSLLEQKKYK